VTYMVLVLVVIEFINPALPGAFKSWGSIAWCSIALVQYSPSSVSPWCIMALVQYSLVQYSPGAV
jgi:hypothetical protein